MRSVVDEVERTALIEMIVGENNCIDAAKNREEVLKLRIKEEQIVRKVHLARKAVYVEQLAQLDKKAAKQ